MLRLHLPPNFAAAVLRDAVPLRVEVDVTQAPAVELLPMLALLQRWSGTPQPPRFIQLTRAQLREFAAAAGAQPVWVEDGKPTAWRHDRLLQGSAAPLSEVGSGAPSASAAASSRPSPPQRGARGEDLTPLAVDGSEHFLALTLPSREHPQYDAALALLKENGFTLEPSNRKWWLRDRHKVLNFLALHGEELRTRFRAAFAPNFTRNTAHVRAAEITADVGGTAGGFSVALGVRAGQTDPATLRTALATNRGYVESGGQVYLLDSRRIQQLATAQRLLAGDPQAGVAPQRTVTVSPARTAEVEEILEQLSPGFQPPEAWRARTAALRQATRLPPAPVGPALEPQLRPYQKLGVAWLWHLQRHELGGILADEMGLGKTLQALALLEAVVQGGRSLRTPPVTARSCHLVVCPASLLENWRREAVRFTPGLRVFVHHADRRLATAAEFAAFDLVITSYGTLTRDQTLFAAVPFGLVIADEAQHIKNRRSQNAAALRALEARARFLLTGTPVENSLDDLRSLFDFLLPGYLTRVPAGVRGEDRAWYDERLRAQTAPYILRRTKRSVAPELPEKIEQVLWCELTPTQAAWYRELQERGERELFDLEAGGASESQLKFAALTHLLRLRQLCCDPRLVRKVADGGTKSPTVPGTADPEAVRGPGSPATRGDTPESAKLEAFRELLEEAIDDGHRVLVFSQFTSLLALLREELARRELDHCYLDGSMPARARQAEVDRFQQTDVPLFLLSLKAGGTGLNLTGADTVVIYDPWWNPAAEAQATDRAHRIGQSRTVTAYKLIAAGTVEEKVLALQEEKRALLADVFEASDEAAARLSLADLRDLLRA